VESRLARAWNRTAEIVGAIAVHYGGQMAAMPRLASLPDPAPPRPSGDRPRRVRSSARRAGGRDQRSLAPAAHAALLRPALRLPRGGLPGGVPGVATSHLVCRLLLEKKNGTPTGSERGMGCKTHRPEIANRAAQGMKTAAEKTAATVATQ